jgi:hypothetical protein
LSVLENRMSRPELPIAAVRRTVAAFAGSIFDWLQARCTSDRDYAFGNTYETTWSKEITALLNDRGTASEHQKRYPGSRKTCDVVSVLPGEKALWLEIKGAWLTAQHRTDVCGRVTFLKNPVFRKHLFHPRESALKDITEKLPGVPDEGGIGALLLIGFDSYGCTMDEAIAALVEQAGLDQPSWTELYREWQNAYDGRYRVRCWFWYKSQRRTPSQ